MPNSGRSPRPGRPVWVGFRRSALPDERCRIRRTRRRCLGSKPQVSVLSHDTDKKRRHRETITNTSLHKCTLAYLVEFMLDRPAPVSGRGPALSTLNFRRALLCFAKLLPQDFSTWASRHDIDKDQPAAQLFVVGDLAVYMVDQVLLRDFALASGCQYDKCLWCLCVSIRHTNDAGIANGGVGF